MRSPRAPSRAATTSTSGEVVDAISSLVAKSLLDVEDGPDGGSRYSMLETLRQFAREQLDEAGEPDRWRRRHAEHYAAFAHDAGFGVTGPDEILWEQRARAEIDNVRSAVGWSLDRDTAEERELGVRIVGALAPLRRARLRQRLFGLGGPGCNGRGVVPPRASRAGTRARRIFRDEPGPRRTGPRSRTARDS